MGKPIAIASQTEIGDDSLFELHTYISNFLTMRDGHRQFLPLKLMVFLIRIMLVMFLAMQSDNILSEF